jgi:hypothetical protein
MNKNSAIQVSLSWIFMAIIGTFFIYFGYKVVDTYSENKKVENQFLINDALRTNILKLSTTSGYESSQLSSTYNLFKNKEFEIKCNNNISFFKLDGALSNPSKVLQNFPISTIKINQKLVENSYIYTMGISAPFKITNFVLLLNSNNIFLFDETSLEIAKIFKRIQRTNLKSLKNKKKVKLNETKIKKELQDLNFETITFITDNSTFKTQVVKNYYVVVINTMNKIIIHKKYINNILVQNKSFKYFDIKDKYIFPIFSIYSDTNSFECAYNKFFEIYKKKIDFYIEKSEYLFNLSKNKKLCGVKRNTGTDIISPYVYKELKENLISLKNDSNKLLKIEENIKKLEGTNTYFIKNNCVLVY